MGRGRAHDPGGEGVVQAEGVGDLVDATAPEQARLALQQLDGALSRRLAQLRDGLLELEALLSYDIDFPEEDEGPLVPTRAPDHLDRLAAALETMIVQGQIRDLHS